MPKLSIQLLTFLIMISIYTSCKVTDNEITGTYTSRSIDTLVIDGQNKTYSFTDKLNKNQLRRTKGTWQRLKPGISFYSFPRPTVGHNATTKRDSSSHWTVYKIYLGDTDERIPIISGASYLQGQIPMLIRKMHGSVDTLIIDKKNFDSVALNTYDYDNFIIHKTDAVNAHYTVRFYPTDNVYMFDKYYFKVKRNKLIGYRNQKRTGYVFRKKSGVQQ